MSYRGSRFVICAALVSIAAPALTHGAIQTSSSGSGTEADPFVIEEWELTLMFPAINPPFDQDWYEGWSVTHTYWSRYDFTVTGTSPSAHWHNANETYDLFENYIVSPMATGSPDWVFDNGWGGRDLNEWTVDFQPRYITGESVVAERTRKSVMKSVTPDGTTVTESLMMHDESGEKYSNILEEIENWHWTIDEAGLKTGVRTQFDYVNFCITYTDYFVEAVSFSPFVGIQHENSWTDCFMMP